MVLDYIKEIDRNYTCKIDITLIDNGAFAPRYRELQTEAIKVIKQAKAYESMDKQKSFDLYQQAYNIYSELESLIDKNTSKLNWAKCRKRATSSTN